MLQPKTLFSTPERFLVSLDDQPLRRRLRETRWIESSSGNAGPHGIDQSALRALVAYWLEHYDWDRTQAAMNWLDHYRVVIDGQHIHYVHVRSPIAGATPLILTHGWPWTFWDMRKVFAPLTDPLRHGGTQADAFELIVPSLPGFGFSSPAQPAGGNFWKTADLWHCLMTEVLGFARYGAAGGDWGAFVSSQLGHKFAEHVIAIHVTQATPLDLFSTGHPWRVRTPGPNEPSRASLQYERRYASHLAAHMIEPDTLAHALNDSPAGTLAWLLQRWQSWGSARDEHRLVLNRGQMLANTTIYWAGETLASSLRFYANAGLEPWEPSHLRFPPVEVPTGVTMLGGDLLAGTDLAGLPTHFAKSRRGLQYNLVHVAAHENGGHFAHFENPAAVVADIRATFHAARRHG